MLVIRRRVGESFRVGDGIKCTVLELTGTAARLGIEGPRQIPVYRKEIFKRMAEERAASAADPTSALSLLFLKRD